jgi:hypothetical protein
VDFAVDFGVDFWTWPGLPVLLFVSLRRGATSWRGFFFARKFTQGPGLAETEEIHAKSTAKSTPQNEKFTPLFWAPFRDPAPGQTDDQL